MCLGYKHLLGVDGTQEADCDVALGKSGVAKEEECRFGWFVAIHSFIFLCWCGVCGPDRGVNG